MPTQLALLLTFAFCAVMLWRDTRVKPRVSAALWLPVVWIFIIGSRFLSQWLDVIGLTSGAGAGRVEDGNPLDAVFFLALIAAGIVVLVRRRVSLTEFVWQNRWMTVFFVYCFLAILWSDFPFVAFKRWIKILGHPVMALIVLTEANRLEAMRRVLKRTAYLYVPLSVAFIKYLPQGRHFDQWSGRPYLNGISLSKNEFGALLMLLGVALVWNVLCSLRVDPTAARKREEVLVSSLFLGLIGWMFFTADSATAFVCMMLALGVMVAVGIPVVSKRHVGLYVVGGVVLVLALQSLFDLYAQALAMLGRDATLTDRTAVWAYVLQMDINPIIGAGFESFWLGSRLEKLWARWWWQPNQAHNGYIETYLNLGWIGVAILAMLIVATFRKSRRELLNDFDLGRFRLAILLMVLVFNYTEAAFKGLAVMWTMFHLISIDYPRGALVPVVKEAAFVPTPRRWTLSAAVASGWRGGRAVSDPAPAAARRWVSPSVRERTTHELRLDNGRPQRGVGHRPDARFRRRADA